LKTQREKEAEMGEKIEGSVPLITCIIPVFNGGRFLKEALDNIFEQSYRPLEVIVVDDGSTDNTKAVATSYGEKVQYLWQPNTGPWVARNLGISAANGDFVAFQDADDLWHSEKLARHMAHFQKQPKLDVSVCMIQNFWTSELHEEENKFRDDRRSKPIPGYTCPGMLVRRSQFEIVGLFDKNLRHAAATDWFLRAKRKGTIVELLPDTLVFRRLHQLNRSRIHASNSQNEYLKILQTHIKERRQGKDKP
jgi:glycosyltransferase involved in cell wall biosynthesis